MSTKVKVVAVCLLLSGCINAFAQEQEDAQNSSVDQKSSTIVDDTGSAAGKTEASANDNSERTQQYTPAQLAYDRQLKLINKTRRFSDSACKSSSSQCRLDCKELDYHLQQSCLDFCPKEAPCEAQNAKAAYLEKEAAKTKYSRSLVVKNPNNLVKVTVARSCVNEGDNSTENQYANTQLDPNMFPIYSIFNQAGDFTFSSEKALDSLNTIKHTCAN